MASTYSTNLAIELIGTGDQAGSWGNTTNTNLGTLIEQAISGYVTQAVSTGTDTTITIPNGATGVARNMYIELTGTGGTNTNLIVPANKKLYFIFNNSTGAVTVKVSGQTGVSVPQGKKVVLTSNGTDIVNGLNYIADFASNSATITQLTATSATITNLTLTSLVISNLSIASANVTTLTSASATITNLLATSLTVSSGSTLNGGVVINEPGADVDFRVEGDTDANLIFADASADFVGIGTSTPATKLDVSGRAQFVNNGFNYVLVDSTASDSYFRLASAGTVKWYLRNNTANTNALEITPDAGSTTGLFLTQSGNLGIGTASPTNYGATYKTLAVNGSSTGIVDVMQNGTVYGQLSTEANVYKVEAVGASTVLRLVTNGATRATLDTSGNLGLGVTPSLWGAGSQAMQNGGGSLFQYNNDRVFIGQNNYIDTSFADKFIGNGYATRYRQYQGTHAFFVSTASNSSGAGASASFTQAMTLDASSNLIVGTTVNHPSAKIFAAGPINTDWSSTIALRYNVSGQTNNYYKGMTGTSIESALARGLHIFNYDADGNPGINFYPNSYAGQIASASMTLNPSGNLGIGTSSPTRRLSLNEAASTQVWTGYSQNNSEKMVVGLDASGNGNFLVTANAPAIFSTNNTERARIQANGRVAIGTTSGNSTLTVVTNNAADGSGSTQAFLGRFDRGTSNTAVNILTVSNQSNNCGVAIYARLVAVSATSNEAAVIEFWASITRAAAGADNTTAITPVVAKAIVGTAISAGTLAWSGKTLQYTPSSTANYIGYTMELQVTCNDSASIAVLP